MLVGLGLALCFRRAPNETELTIPAPGDALTRQAQPVPRSIAVTQLPPAPQPRSLPPAPDGPRQVSPTVVTPGDQPAPPPEFPKSYPGDNQAAGTRWGASMTEMLPAAAGAPYGSPPTHKVVDGDSLALLAERYLGSQSRAMEIYQANRNVLTQPDILPIGVELKIPRTEQSASTK